MKGAVVLFLLLALLFPGLVHAGPCGDYEYAELQDMERAVFLKEYCKVAETTKTYGKLSLYGGKRKDNLDFNSCYELMMKMERIYLKRFNIDNRKILVDQCK